jgi:hypothetical protein
MVGQITDTNGKVSEVPINDPSNETTTAHFARVFGVNKANNTIFIENTIHGDSQFYNNSAYWELTFDQYLQVSSNPEQNAYLPQVQNGKSSMPNIYQSVYQWAVVIDLTK